MFIERYKSIILNYATPSSDNCFINKQGGSPPMLKGPSDTYHNVMEKETLNYGLSLGSAMFFDAYTNMQSAAAKSKI